MAIHADSCSDSCKNPVLYIFRRHLNTWANYGYTTLGRKALFGKKDLVSEADASKLSIQIWLSHAAPALVQVVGVGVAGHRHAGVSEQFPLIFRWPPVLAWRRDTTAGRVLAMLKFVPFRQDWPGGRPGTERCIDHIV